MRWQRALGVLGFGLTAFVAGTAAAQSQAQLADGERERARAARVVDVTRSVAARPHEMPAGAVQLAAPSMTAARPRAAPRRDLVRVPLTARPATGSPLPAPADVFGIAAGTGRIDNSRAEAPVLELPANSLTIVTSQRGKANIEQQELNAEEKTALPWLVVETQPTPNAPSLRTGRPFLTLARAITWDASLSRHVAEFLFGLDGETGEPGPLQQAIDVRFGVSCEDVTPPRAQIASIGPSGYDTVKVACSREVKNERERQYLELFAGQGNLRYPFRIPHRPGPLVLSSSDDIVVGFGFETVELTATQLEEDGSPLRSGEARNLLLSATGGDLDASTLVIGQGASDAHIVVRPSGVGDLEIIASSGALQSAPLRIRLTWPLVPIAAMLAGGALGGLVSAFNPRRRKQRWRRIIEGAVMGVLVTLAVLLVPTLASLPARALGTELSLFVVAALAGFAGVPLVDRLAQLVFPALRAKPDA
jgi:hypothetical protein